MHKRPTSYDEIPLMLSVEDLMPILRIGRNTAYDLVRSGQIDSIHLGAKYRIPKQALMAYLAGEKSHTNAPCTAKGPEGNMSGNKL